MDRIETRTAQLGLVGSSRHQASDLITTAEPANPLAPEARKGRLYIVVEADPELPRATQSCQLVARTIRRVFYEDSTYSVTAALRAALRAANKALYEQNVSQAAGRRAQVSCTCAVWKEGELYVAQVQPAQAYVRGEGQLRALPAHPSWDAAHVSVAPFAQMGGLGASLFIEPELYRCTLRAGDAAIICSSDFAQLLGRADVDLMMRLDDPEAITAELERLALEGGLADAHALALVARPTHSAARREPHSAAGAGERGRPKARSLGGWLGALTGAGRPRGRNPRDDAGAARRAAPDALHTLPEQPTHSAQPPPRPAPISMGESLSQRYDRQREERTERAAQRTRAAELPPSTFIGEDYPAPPATRRVDLGDGGALESSGRPYRPRYELRPIIDLTWGERLAMPFRHAALAFGDALRTRRSRRPAPPPQRPILRGQGLSYRRTRPPFPWALLALLVIAVGGLVSYGIYISDQNSTDLAEEYFAIADQRLAEVSGATDEASAIERLDIASEALDEVRASPEVTRSNVVLWTRYLELQRAYERSLAAVQRVTFFDEPQVLASHPLPNGQFSSVVVPPPLSGITDTAVLEGLNYLYALDADAQNARLYRIPREGGAAVAHLSPNQTVGTSVVGPLRATLWRIDQTVAVDESTTGFGYYFRQGDSWNYSKLGASEIWNVRDRLDIEEYDGNLYVWGAEPNEVLRFRSGFYGDTPDYWIDRAALAELDLTTVVDMAVDRGIYLLRADGTVMVFDAGLPVGEIRPDGISPPISTVTRFAVTGSPEQGSIYMLEPINERIIQMDRLTGRVIQQIKMRPDDPVRLNVLREFTVDDSGSRPILYLANGGQIIRAELPAPPRAFSEGAQATPAPSAPTSTP
jgi:serine/threonine protein phosphatase PrpC